MNYESYGGEIADTTESDFEFDEPTELGSSVAPVGGRAVLDDNKALRIGIMGSLLIQGFSVVLTLVIGLVLISNRPRGNYVQLVDGQVVEAGEFNPNYRSPQTIRRFVYETITQMFSWNGYKPATNLEESRKAELDPGVAVDGGRKVPTSAYYASFALREGLRESFLRELSRLVPGEVLRGSVAGRGQAPIAAAPPTLQTVALIDFLSEPKKVGDGRWEVRVICTVIELPQNGIGKELLRFNKTLVIRAVEPIRAQDDPPRAVNIRKAGLQIEEIKNLTQQ